VRTLYKPLEKYLQFIKRIKPRYIYSEKNLGHKNEQRVYLSENNAMKSTKTPAHADKYSYMNKTPIH
jgi:hypothetical protein